MRLASTLAVLGLLACGERQKLAEASRDLGEVELMGQTYRFRAALRAWRHPLSLDPSAPALPHDAVYVSWEATSGRRPAQALDQTWEMPSLAEGERRFEQLSLQYCLAPDRLAFRLLEGEPQRLLVPDEVGAAGGIAEGGSCEEALSWSVSAERWRSDLASGRSVCGHLYRTGRLDAAVRCLLRDPPQASGAPASRQEIPRAAEDPAFDGALLAALDPEASGDRSRFSPARAAALLAEVGDREQVAALARRWRAIPARDPWQEAVAGATP